MKTLPKFVLIFIFGLLSIQIYYTTDATYSLDSLGKHYVSRLNRIGKYRLTRFGNVDNCGKRKRNVENRKCLKQCTSDADCRGSKRRCLCDGECGLSCIRITTMCTKIGEFKNGLITYHPDNYFGSQLFYECNPGFTLLGNKMRVCEGDGWWSGESPVCIKETFCDNLPFIANAIPNVQINNQTRYKGGTEIEYQCDIGYTNTTHSESSNKIMCFDNGKWSEINFKCVRVKCDKPVEILNGIIKANDYFYSSVIEYKCVPGYQIRDGDYLRECDLDGRWSGLQPKCEPIDCGEPPFLKNGIANYNSTKFESTAHYDCVNANYLLEGINSYIKCLPNGRWENHLPKCVEKKCSLNPHEYSKKHYSIFTSNTNQAVQNNNNNNFLYSINVVIRIMCQPGFELVGNSQIICKPDVTSGVWSDTPPQCRQEFYCPFVSPPENGRIHSNKLSTLNGYPINTSIEFSCLPGYHLKGTRQYNCIERRSNFSGGEWNEPVRINCQREFIASTTISTAVIFKTVPALSTSTTKATFEYTNLGEYIESAAAESPDLSSPFESCKIDSSSMLLSYANMMSAVAMQMFDEFVFSNASIGTYIHHGGTVSYSCVKYQPTAVYVAKCLNGTLFMQQNCNELSKEKMPCVAPPKVPNGYNKYSSTVHGSKALYQCFNGYELAKNHGELRCMSGEWIGQIPACLKINCGYPGNLQNGRIFYIGTLSEYTYQPYMNTVGQNKQIRYECDKDYRLIGPNGSTCINGNWKPSVKLAKCVKDATKVTMNHDEGNSKASIEKQNSVEAAEDENLMRSFNPKFFMDDESVQNSAKDMKKITNLKRLKKHKMKHLNDRFIKSKKAVGRRFKKMRPRVKKNNITNVEKSHIRVNNYH